MYTSPFFLLIRLQAIFAVFIIDLKRNCYGSVSNSIVWTVKTTLISVCKAAIKSESIHWVFV